MKNGMNSLTKINHHNRSKTEKNRPSRILELERFILLYVQNIYITLQGKHSPLIQVQLEKPPSICVSCKHNSFSLTSSQDLSMHALSFHLQNYPASILHKI